MVEDLVRVRDKRISLLEQHCRDQDQYIDNLKRSAGQSLEELQNLREEVAGLKGQTQRTQVEFTLLRDLAQTAKREAQELRHHLAVVCNKREALAVHLLRRCKIEAAFAQLRWAVECSSAHRRRQENKAESPGAPKQFRGAALRAHCRAWMQVSCQNTNLDDIFFHFRFGVCCLSLANVFHRWMEFVHPRTRRGGSPGEPADVWNLIREFKTVVISKNRQKESHSRASVHGAGLKTLQHFIHWHKFARKRLSAKRICSQLFGRHTILIQKDVFSVWIFHVRKRLSAKRICAQLFGRHTILIQRDVFSVWIFHVRNGRKNASLQERTNKMLRSRAFHTWIESVDLAAKARAKLNKAYGYSDRSSKERAKACLRRWREETEMKKDVRYALQTALQGKERPCMETAFTAMKRAVRRRDNLWKAGESFLARHRSKRKRAFLLHWEESTRVKRVGRVLDSRVVTRRRARTLLSVLRVWHSSIEQRHWSRHEGERFHSAALWLGPVRMALRKWATVLQDRRQEEWVRKMADICAWPKLDQRLTIGRAIREWRRAVEVQVWQRRKRVQGKCRRNHQLTHQHFVLWTDAVSRLRRQRRTSARCSRKRVHLHLCVWAELLPWHRRRRKAMIRHASRLVRRFFLLWADVLWQQERGFNSASDSSDSDCGDVDEKDIQRVMGPERAKKWGVEPPTSNLTGLLRDSASDVVGTQMLGEVRRLQACLVHSAARKEELLASLRAPTRTSIDASTWP